MADFQNSVGGTKGEAATTCQTPGELAVTVKRSDTTDPIPGAEVTLSGGATLGTKQTDNSGTALWSICQPGDYVASVILRGDAAKEYANPEDVLVNVASSESKAVEALAVPKGELVVLLKRKDTGAVIPDAELSLSGGPPADNQKTDAQGTARWRCGAGNYLISVAFSGADAKKYEVPPNKTTSVSAATTKSEEILVEPLYRLRLILVDGKDNPISGRPWEMSSPKAKKGTTGKDGLIEVNGHVADTQGAVTVKMRGTSAAPVTPAGAKPPPAYPPTIRRSDFKDQDATPVLPPDADASVAWSLTIANPESTNLDTDSALRDRLHNLGFAVDTMSDAAATQAAVKAYQLHYQNNPNGNGVLADIAGNLKSRHDNP